MAYIDEQLFTFKRLIEDSIITGGVEGKASMIRSSRLINLIHDAVKYELQHHDIDPDLIFPHYLKSKPEIKLAGFLKQKTQDVCVIPKGIEKEPRKITWGPMAFQNKRDPYGQNFSDNMLVINVRSQMSSLAKNSDTLFERTFAEALNLHMQYPNMVLGEVYLIPVYEYDDEAVKRKKVAFRTNQTDVEKYISFFDSINNRRIDDEAYMYERCTLLVVDFKRDKPKLYRNSAELKQDGVISRDFKIEYSTLGFDEFASDIIEVYKQRYNIAHLLKYSELLSKKKQM